MRIGVGLPFKDQRGQPLDAAGLGLRARPFESDIALEQLQQVRSLLPADPRPPATSQATANSLGGAA